jgi:hypothetical protein
MKISSLIIALAIATVPLSGLAAKETYNVPDPDVSRCWYPKTSDYDDGEITVQFGHGLTTVCRIHRPFCIPAECVTSGYRSD